MLNGFRRGYESTSGNAKVSNLLLAVAYCGNNGTRFPEWVAAAFKESILGWMVNEFSSLDAAFGAAPRKHAKAKRNRVAAWRALTDHLSKHPNEPRDWNAIAQQTGWGHTLLEKVYAWDGYLLRELFPVKSQKSGVTRK